MTNGQVRFPRVIDTQASNLLDCHLLHIYVDFKAADNGFPHTLP